MRKSLSDAGVGALKPRAARYAHPDPELRRPLRPRAADAAPKVFVAVTRDPTSGKQVWATIGGADLMTVDGGAGEGPRRDQARPGRPARVRDASQGGVVRRRRRAMAQAPCRAPKACAAPARSPACSRPTSIPRWARSPLSRHPPQRRRARCWTRSRTTTARGRLITFWRSCARS